MISQVRINSVQAVIKGPAFIFLSGFQVGTVDEFSCCSPLHFKVLVN